MQVISHYKLLCARTADVNTHILGVDYTSTLEPREMREAWYSLDLSSTHKSILYVRVCELRM